MRGGIVRSIVWWIYYTLFLGLCIFIFVTVARYGIHMLFMDQRKLNAAQILYGVAVGVMIFGLLSLSIAYLTRSIWYRIKGPPGNRGENLVSDRALADKLQEVPHPSSKP